MTVQVAAAGVFEHTTANGTQDEKQVWSGCQSVAHVQEVLEWNDHVCG